VVVEEVLNLQGENPATLKGSYDPFKGADTVKQKPNESLEIEPTPCRAITRPQLVAAVESGDVNAVSFG